LPDPRKDLGISNSERRHLDHERRKLPVMKGRIADTQAKRSVEYILEECANAGEAADEWYGDECWSYNECWSYDSNNMWTSEEEDVYDGCVIA
jgi:hypothetical protein